MFIHNGCLPHFTDLIKNVNKMADFYESTNSNSPQVLRVADVRKVYLITYSDADINIFDRGVFANAVVESFKAVTAAKVTQWAPQSGQQAFSFVCSARQAAKVAESKETFERTLSHNHQSLWARWLLHGLQLRDRGRQRVHH